MQDSVAAESAHAAVYAHHAMILCVSFSLSARLLQKRNLMDQHVLLCFTGLSCGPDALSDGPACAQPLHAHHALWSS